MTPSRTRFLSDSNNRNGSGMKNEGSKRNGNGSTKPRNQENGASLLERRPPYDSDAEMAVLRSAILDERVLDEIEAIVTPDDFFDDGLGHLAREMFAMIGEG